MFFFFYIDQMTELFQRNKSTISRHIKSVLDEGELRQVSTVAFFATIQNEGKRIGCCIFCNNHSTWAIEEESQTHLT